jgi:rubredoxin
MSTKPSVKFTCPRCAASHERGYVDGASLFRCLGCGYVGSGQHPDPDIDAEIVTAEATADAWNESHGLPSTPRAEWTP